MNYMTFDLRGIRIFILEIEAYLSIPSHFTPWFSGCKINQVKNNTLSISMNLHLVPIMFLIHIHKEKLL